MFRAYIKDCLDLNGNTKALLNLESGKIKEDRITTANSTFVAKEISDNVSIGDIFCLINDGGKILYYGIISSIKDRQITTKQIYDIYNGEFIYSIVDDITATTLEEQIKKIIEYYSNGNVYNSTYVDTLISTKLSSIQLEHTNEITTLLESDLDENQKPKYTELDMVKWLYDIYDKYGIVLDFTIPLQVGQSKVKIWKPNYSGLKITDGFEFVNSITPTTETQTTNKIVVYWNSDVEGEHQAKEYRETDVLTSSGIVKEPSSIVGRLNQINTKFIFSDDDIETIIASNLNEELFNHKIDFNVNLNNRLFTFDDLKLDMPIEVFIGKDYYNTLITAKEFSFDKNGTISDIKITGGKIRNTLTNKLTMGLIR